MSSQNIRAGSLVKWEPENIDKLFCKNTVTFLKKSMLERIEKWRIAMEKQTCSRKLRSIPRPGYALITLMDGALSAHAIMMGSVISGYRGGHDGSHFCL